MAYTYSSNKGMTDSGAGSYVKPKTTFNYSAPKTVTRTTTPVTVAKANTTTQTRYEKEQLALQTAAAAAAKARADATFAAINAQKIETARLAQEAYARAQAAAAAAAAAEAARAAAAVEAARIAEAKRQKLQLANWEDATSRPGKGPGLASAIPPFKSGAVVGSVGTMPTIPPKQSFWDQVRSVILPETPDTSPTSPFYLTNKTNFVSAAKVKPGAYSSFMQPKGPLLPGQTPFGPLQDKFTGEDKLSYQSHSPSYWENATPDKFNFYRYPNGEEVANEAEAAYQSFAKVAKENLAKSSASQETIGIDPNSQLAALITSGINNGSITSYNDALTAQKDTENNILSRGGFDPTSGFGQRLLMEQAGQRVPSYANTWQGMQTDRNAKTLAANNLTAGYKNLLDIKANPPDLSSLNEPAKKYKRPQDMFVRVVLNGRMYSVPREMLNFASDYPWKTETNWYEPPPGFTDAGHQWKEAKTYGWQPPATPPDTQPLDNGGGGDGGGGGGGYGDGGGYGSGGSYWSPSGYYDNQYTKERYGYFQNLAKWVI